jgi:hypothetical protein
VKLAKYLFGTMEKEFQLKYILKKKYMYQV